MDELDTYTSHDSDPYDSDVHFDDSIETDSEDDESQELNF